MRTAVVAHPHRHRHPPLRRSWVVTPSPSAVVIDEQCSNTSTVTQSQVIRRAVIDDERRHRTAPAAPSLLLRHVGCFCADDIGRVLFPAR